MRLKSDRLRRELRWLSGLCWVSGLHPFTLDGKFSFWLLLQSILCLLSTAALIYYKVNLIFFRFIYKFNYKLLLVLNTGSIFLAQIICIGESLVNRKQYVQMLESLDRVDFMLKKLGVEGQSLSLFSLVGVVVMQIGANLMHFFASNYNWLDIPILELLGYYASYAVPITLLFTENKIRIILEIILRRFQDLNDFSVRMLDKFSPTRPPSLANFQSVQKVEECVVVFDQLYQVYKTVKKVYSPVLLMITTNILVIVVSTTYYCASDVHTWLVDEEEHEATTPMELLLSVVVDYSWAFVRFLELFLLVKTSVHLSLQVKT